MDVALREAKALERGIAFGRWGGVALALVLGPIFPNLSLPAVVVLGIGIAAYNVWVMRASSRALTLAEHRRIERLTFMADLTALAVGMLLFSPDPYWTTFLIVPVVIMAGAFRFGSEGALASSVVLGVSYLGISVFRAIAFGYGIEPERVLFHLSVFALTAFMVERILREGRGVRAERERLIGELQRRIAEDDALVEVGRIVGRLRDPAEVVPAVLEASRKVFRFERATVFTIDEQRGEYRAIYRLTPSGEPPGAAPAFAIGEGLVAAALAEDRPLLVRDVLSDPRYVPRHMRERRRSVILVPLRVAGRPVAVLSLSRGLPDEFGPEDLRQAEIVAAYVAQVLENERLFAEASQAEALRAADRMKDEFLATVSHELRTPLAVVRGALELLQRGVAAREQLFDQATRNLERLSHSVQDLIDLAQLREARVELEREYTSARDLLEETSRAHQLLATQRGQSLIVEGRADLPPAYVDRARMLQVLGNVVANAIHYGPLDAPITLFCEHVDDELRFRIVDRGPGVSVDERDRIFERFYRAEATRDTVSGTGLGLAIARRLIELHGGRIWFEDAEPGSAFVIAVPLDTTNAEAAS